MKKPKRIRRHYFIPYEESDQASPSQGEKPPEKREVTAKDVLKRRRNPFIGKNG